MPGMSWDALERAVAASDWEQALRIALDGWRDQRRAPLADLVDALSARVNATPIRATGAAAFHAEWLARARTATAIDLVPLLAALVRSLPVAEGAFYLEGSARTRYAAWFERLNALAELPEDPRTATAVFDVIRKAPWSGFYGSDVAALYTPAIALLQRIGDDRIVEAARTLAASPTASRQSVRHYLAEALPALAAGIERDHADFVPLADDDSARCERVLETLGAARAPRTSTSAERENEGALLELVVTTPDDDDARAVLADLWLERDDARGRLVALQLETARRGATEEDEKTIRRILREHEKTWLGDLALVTKGRVYRRGFLDEVELQQNSAADPKVWESTALDPHLGTVRTLHKGKASEAHYRRFVFSPAMRSLRDLVVVSKGMLKEVCERTEPWPIEHLRLDFMPDKKSLGSVLASTALPKLTHLSAGLTRDNIDKLVTLAATFTKERPLVRLTAVPVRWYENTESFAGWLAATLGRLTHLPEVGLALPTPRENRIVARRGKAGLRLELVTTHLHFASQIVRVLEAVEHVLVRAPEGEVVASSDAYDADVLLNLLPPGVLELDATWTAAHAAPTTSRTPRHRDA
jgi:uncharacterized protein (TIGR02996 family)